MSSRNVRAYVESIDRDLIVQAFEMEPKAFQWLLDTVKNILQKRVGQLNYSTAGDESFNMFGLCPVCHKQGLWHHVWAEHYLTCPEHKVAWWVGSNLFPAWKKLTTEQCEANKRAIEEEYTLVKPYYGVDPLLAERGLQSLFEGDMDWLEPLLGTLGAAPQQ